MTKSSNSLIFMTYQYPYLPGEYFIESEIDHLAESFSMVYVFPYRCLWWKASEEPRVLPEGVELWDPAKIPLITRVAYCARAILGAPVLVKRQRNTWPGANNLLRLSWLKSTRMAFKTLVTAYSLQWFGARLTSSEKRTGYAYWRDTGASALGLSRECMGLEKVFVRAHRADIYLSEVWPDESTIHNSVDRIFPVSKNGLDYLVEQKGLPREKIEVARLGVRLPEATAPASENDTVRIVSCSNLVPVKRVDLIAQVVQSLPFKVEWTHIGDGPEIDAVKLVTLGYDAEHEVIFKGRLSNQQVLQYYQSNPVDIFINLSESEGVPVSIMEAMAHGIPCVATDVGGTAEIVNDENGAVVAVDANVESVRDAIKRVLANDKARAAARLQAEHTCSAHRNYQEFCNLLTNPN